MYLLAPDDAARVASGYACPQCLEEFDTHRLVCPVCKHRTDDFLVGEVPAEWAPQDDGA
jgi:predicted amidophosphoribosyltransferase